MRDRHTPARLAEASSILATFVPGAALAIARTATIRPHAALLLDGRRLALVPNAAGSGLASIGSGVHRVRLGGTAEAGIATLIRFARGMTRRPYLWWADHFRPPTVDALLSTTYLDDPAMVACVLCGRAEPTDWMGDADRRRCGPCCGFAVCLAGMARVPEGSGTYGVPDEAEMVEEGSIF